MAGVSPQKSPVLFFSVSKFLSLLDKILDSTKLLKQLSLLWSILMQVFTALNWWTESNLKKKKMMDLIGYFAHLYAESIRPWSNQSSIMWLLSILNQ